MVTVTKTSDIEGGLYSHETDGWPYEPVSRPPETDRRLDASRPLPSIPLTPAQRCAIGESVDEGDFVWRQDVND